MAEMEVGGKTNYFKYRECEKDQVLVANMVYKGTKESKYGRTNVFQGAGERTVLNKAGQLDYKLDEFVAIGDTVSIIYSGKETIEKGEWAGEKAHNFTVTLHEDVPNKKGVFAKVADAFKGKKEEAVVEEDSGSSLLDELNK